jgi:IS605 OrfB family transposase
MKLIAQIKLVPTEEQAQLLLDTITRSNEATDYISDWCWENRTFGKFAIQRALYYDIRSQFDLSAQMTIRAISKVADSYKMDKKTHRKFNPFGAIAYDDRILSYKLPAQTVSILSLKGRLTIPFATGQRQLNLLRFRQGESDLYYRDGTFYLLATCAIADPAPIDIEGVLGIDLGIINIASDSDGEQHSGSEIRNVRIRHRRLRKKLQKKGTKSAKRKLKKLSGKKRRFTKDVNHCISKQVVKKAQDTNRAIALENLSGIRSRARLRKPQRTDLHNWSFAQFSQFVDYKARLTGVPVIYVDPHWTSQECSNCGYIDKKNRPNQETFICQKCGHADHADTNAARVIARRATINMPIVSANMPYVCILSPGTSPRALAVGS